MAAVAIRGTTYPIVLPKLKDPRLHLAATITSLQVLGQVAFHFDLSIAQILVSLATVAVIEVVIVFRSQRVLMWPASALLTGNGVAFVLRVPGTVHGDWWSLRGWWIYAGTAAVSLLSKYVIAWKGEHVFNPSNFGLVAVFVVLGRTRAEPLAFWWGPMSAWMVLALAIIVTGGFAILRRLKLLRVALSFWAAFALGIGGVALAGHAMWARWHLGPIESWSFWWVLVTSPEVLVFFFFMITDPKTAPRGPRTRVLYGITLGVLASALIALTTTEYAAKVALLSSLAIVCVVKFGLQYLPAGVVSRRRVAVAAALAGAAYLGAVSFADNTPPAAVAAGTRVAKLPPVAIDPSPGVQTQLDRATAATIANALVAVHPARTGETVRIHLEPGTDQSPPFAVAHLGSATYTLHQTAAGAWALPAHAATAAPAPPAVPAGQTRLADVAASVGLGFRQDSFRFGASNETKAMMGGGVCFLDYNGDGYLDLFAVDSYASADAPTFEAHGGLPTSRLYENRHGTFRDVTRQAHAGLAVQGDGCVAGDLNGDGRTDLVETTTAGVIVLWNHGGTFTQQALPGSGWYTGAAIADVNGDGRPDLFVAGYADPNEPVQGSYAGFPTNLTGVRDELFLNAGGGRFREVGVQAGLEASGFRHGLGALFSDANGDGRPDLYVANDEDPNDLYVNVPWPGGAAADPAGLGFRFEERGQAAGVADPFAGMGIAFQNGTLFVTNSRGEPPAAYRLSAKRFVNARPQLDRRLGTGFAGWGATWVDLRNSGRPDLVLAAGAIPVTGLQKSAEAVRVLTPSGLATLTSLPRNGRGVAAADIGNDGRMTVAVNTIGGRLLLLRPTGPVGHWLDVRLDRFVPGAVVTAAGVSRELQAGSSYLSSEDPRAHFGLGTKTSVPRLVVRYPWGAQTVLRNVRADRVVDVHVPARPAARAVAVAAAAHSCTAPTVSHARFWNDVARRVVTDGGAPAPVQARDLYLSSLATWRAYRSETTLPARNAAIDRANYRLLLWLASFDHDLARVFHEVRSAYCGAPSATGDRIADALIAQSLHDGSNERLHYADPTFVPQNAPLIVQQPGGVLHDATFWQPLALAQVSPRGAGAVPAQVQSFVGSQWGRVRTFALRRPLDPGAPRLGDPDGKAYAAAAMSAIRATAERVEPATFTPARANAALPSLGLREDARLDLALNGALNDAAVAVYRAKRRYDSPRPIEMIRYLAFNHRLPLVVGLTRETGGVVQVRLAGRWVRGDRWTPPAVTPPSPGWPSADAAFAAAAHVVLSRLAPEHAPAMPQGSGGGVELPMDVAAGRGLGAAVGRIALAR